MTLPVASLECTYLLGWYAPLVRSEILAGPFSLMAEYFFSEHARLEMKRRGLPEAVVRAVLAAPEQSVEIRQGRVILQSRVEMESPPKTYLLRVFIDVDREPPEVVTVYRTSKISKYWRQDR